jgi:hypothetical protein
MAFAGSTNCTLAFSHSPCPACASVLCSDFEASVSLACVRRGHYPRRLTLLPQLSETLCPDGRSNLRPRPRVSDTDTRQRRTVVLWERLVEYTQQLERWSRYLYLCIWRQVFLDSGTFTSLVASQPLRIPSPDCSLPTASRQSPRRRDVGGLGWAGPDRNEPKEQLDSLEPPS